MLNYKIICSLKIMNLQTVMLLLLLVFLIMKVQLKI